jgi:hypothetical protein
VRCVASALVIACAATASADPIRLRADALATTASPAGLVVLEADGDEGSWLSAETLVWTAARDDETVGDVLVIAVHARSADGHMRATLGRFVATLGALRPVQIDGAGGRVRLPHRFDVEAYTGIPVVPTGGATRTWDWMAGARVARRLGDWGAAGLAFLEQRDGGKLVTEHLGADAGVEVSKRTSATARAIYDVATPGLADLAVAATHRRGAWRVEGFAGYRASSHLVPATSLFSVLGDIPSQRAGVAVGWRAAPRLDVDGELGARRSDEAYVIGTLRARLRLDDRGASVLTGELRRDGLGADRWTGLRGAARFALTADLAATAELELAIPDDARGRGEVWPWSLLALVKEGTRWRVALALEASASPQDVYRVDVLAQLGTRWGKP